MHRNRRNGVQAVALDTLAEPGMACSELVGFGVFAGDVVPQLRDLRGQRRLLGLRGLQRVRLRDSFGPQRDRCLDLRCSVQEELAQCPACTCPCRWRACNGLCEKATANLQTAALKPGLTPLQKLDFRLNLQ